MQIDEIKTSLSSNSDSPPGLRFSLCLADTQSRGSGAIRKKQSQSDISTLLALINIKPTITYGSHKIKTQTFTYSYYSNERCSHCLWFSVSSTYCLPPLYDSVRKLTNKSRGVYPPYSSTFVFVHVLKHGDMKRVR